MLSHSSLEKKDLKRNWLTSSGHNNDRETSSALYIPDISSSLFTLLQKCIQIHTVLYPNQFTVAGVLLIG